MKTEEKNEVQSDHDLLIRIETKLEIALQQLNEFDNRIQTLEKGYWKVIGGAGAIVLLGDIAIKLFIK